MPTISRRSLLASALAAGGTLATGALPVSSPPQRRQPAVPFAEFFRMPMPMPRLIEPDTTRNGVDVYSVAIRRTRTEIVPGLQTEVLTFDGGYPALFRATTGRPVLMNQHNHLGTPVSVHLHGGEVADVDDGGPMDSIDPGDSRAYHYPNHQPHAPLWIHDHTHQLEAEHIYRGLSAFYILQDEDERRLPLPAGRYDVPIMLRDVHLDDKGQLLYQMEDSHGRTTILANGKPWPYFEVAARKYRFRILNSSNLRIFRLRLADGSPMTQIGSDGGLLPQPCLVDELYLTPAERAEVVIDFSHYPVGTRLELENTRNFGKDDPARKVLRFHVTHTAQDPSSIPVTLRTLPPLPEVTGRRSFELSMDDVTKPGAQGYINGRVYDHQRVDTSIPWGSSEVWTISNKDPRFPHNFHLHLVTFRILERDGRPPSAAETGLKDTVGIDVGETVTVQATFDSYRGKYLYHCHFADHMAMGMMGQMEIT
ncbi:multicopper oxidase family protein [Streptomyces gamaensis]|uniref:Multicopper oxidase CueO n=1 Tax=Streptomyces gamaensis TaxID=1763542 RepID=A0ABW0Z823_9ACTN